MHFDGPAVHGLVPVVGLFVSTDFSVVFDVASSWRR
jgi:hypothetical protein